MVGVRAIGRWGKRPGYGGAIRARAEVLLLLPLPARLPLFFLMAVQKLLQGWGRERLGGTMLPTIAGPRAASPRGQPGAGLLVAVQHSGAVARVGGGRGAGVVGAARVGQAGIQRGIRCGAVRVPQARPLPQRDGQPGHILQHLLVRHQRLLCWDAALRDGGQAAWLLCGRLCRLLFIWERVTSRHWEHSACVGGIWHAAQPAEIQGKLGRRVERWGRLRGCCRGTLATCPPPHRLPARTRRWAPAVGLSCPPRRPEFPRTRPLPAAGGRSAAQRSGCGCAEGACWRLSPPPQSSAVPRYQASWCPPGRRRQGCSQMPAELASQCQIREATAKIAGPVRRSRRWRCWSTSRLSPAIRCHGRLCHRHGGSGTPPSPPGMICAAPRAPQTWRGRARDWRMRRRRRFSRRRHPP
mmetsp:Transcript_41008/g.106109  ORF Transcript_41008/g.106109 Transcript_41008/m.106109 type:complete len:411 (+) Transcript_41008:703-1935(+)